jgi:hypothetical protein
LAAGRALIFAMVVARSGRNVSHRRTHLVAELAIPSAIETPDLISFDTSHIEMDRT